MISLLKQSLTVYIKPEIEVDDEVFFAYQLLQIIRRKRLEGFALFAQRQANLLRLGRFLHRRANGDDSFGGRRFLRSNCFPFPGWLLIR